MRTDREVVVLVSVPTEVEAVLLVQTLEANGITAQVTGALTSGFRAEAPGQVQVLVHQENLSKARDVLRENRRR